MKIIVNEIFNHPILTNGKDSLVKEHIIEGDCFDEVFKQIYGLERSSRYDNYRRYEFLDLDIKNSYQNWKRDGVTVEMYYGGGTVD